MDRGSQVVFLDNRPVSVDGGDVDGSIVWALELATERKANR